MPIREKKQAGATLKNARFHTEALRYAGPTEIGLLLLDRKRQLRALKISKETSQWRVLNFSSCGHGAT